MFMRCMLSNDDTMILFLWKNNYVCVSLVLDIQDSLP